MGTNAVNALGPQEIQISRSDGSPPPLPLYLYLLFRYANAVALLEQYVPVTGFINGIFGMVAGGACMVGPTLVAFLVKHTDLG